MTKLEISSPAGFSPTAKFGNVAAGNYVEFEDNGYMRFYGTSQATIDWNFDGAQFARGANAPELIAWNGTNILVPGFDGINTNEYMSKVLEVNHNWAERTALKAHVHWGPTTTGTGNVEWFLEWFALNHSTYSGISTISVVQAAGGVAWIENFAAFPDVVLEDAYDFGTQLGFCIYRIPGAGNIDDTYEADAAILTIGIHVQIDSLGSCQTFIKECE